MVRVACLAALLCLSLPALSDDAPARVTTDTELYCAQLADTVDQARDAPREVRMLSESGRLLCARGEVLPGIKQLRRALALLRGSGGR